MRGLTSFYKSFYGHKFYRYFRRPPDCEIPGFRIQSTVKNPKEVYHHVHLNSGHYPCYIQTYNRGSLGNLNRDDKSKMVIDRAFFDFDVTYPEIKNSKDELKDLRSRGLKNQVDRQQELMKKLRNLIIYEKGANTAIEEAKNFAEKFRESFGNYPALFFSGCKGCHAYTFFKPINLDINRALSLELGKEPYGFAAKIKLAYGYETMDLSVNRDAISRLSRIPYSKHQYTSLTVVPFNVNDSYEDIIEKSVNPPSIEPFEKSAHLSNLGEHLQRIDPVLELNEKIYHQKKSRTTQLNKKGGYGIIKDNRDFFRNVIGSPVKDYPDYEMYHCPFPGHQDKNPSFLVHRYGYKCYGCNRKGNYWQFLKDYYGWNDNQVRNYLKKQ